VARNELLALVGALREPLIAHRTAVLLPQAALARQAGLLGTHCALLLPDAEGDHHRIVPCPPILEAEGSVGQPPAAVAAGEAASGSPTEAAPTLSLTRLPLRTSIDLSIDAWADRAEARARRAFDGAGDQAAQAERLARGGARALFAGVPTALGLKTPRCGLDPFCAVGNWAKRRAEGVYRDFRDDAERRFVRQVDRNAELRLLSAHEQLDVARQGVRDNLSAARGWAHEAVAGLFNLGDTLGTLMTIWLVMVAIKSYLYVLALEVFHETGASSVGFHDAAPIQGRIEAQDGITIPADCRIPVLSFEVGVNQRKGIVLWKPWVASVHRLLHGRWAMSRGSHTPQAQMHFPSRQGSIGAVWHLQPGESVVLHFGNLLGFTENLHIRSEISLRLSTLLFGRFVFHVAHCPAEPGLLLLSLPGNAVLPDAAVQEVPLGRIRAFDRQARFRVASQRSWRAVFKDGFNLRRVDGDPASRGLVLVGASSGDELRFQGLIRFVRTFVWPL
jgi:hypothetical protein